MAASGADKTSEYGDFKYVNLANQPSAVPTKGVAMGAKEDTHMVTNTGNASRSESKPVQAIQTKPVTSQIVELDARTILKHAQPVVDRVHCSSNRPMTLSEVLLILFHEYPIIQNLRSSLSLPLLNRFVPSQRKN